MNLSCGDAEGHCSWRADVETPDLWPSPRLKHQRYTAVGLAIDVKPWARPERPRPWSRPWDTRRAGISGKVARVSDALWILVVVAVALALVAVRGWRTLSLEQRWRSPLAGVPSELAELWSSGDPRTRQARAQGPLSSIDVLFHLSRFDRRQLVRFHPTTPPTNLEGLLEAFQVAEAADDSEAPAGPSLGERLLAQQLSSEAHDVSFEPAEAAREHEAQGCGARVDGIRAELVASADPAAVQGGLDRAPDMLVVTVAEHARAFAQQARVVALPEVTLALLTSAPAAENSTQRRSIEQSERGLVRVEVVAEDAGPLSLTGIGTLLASQALSPALLTSLRTAHLLAKGDAAWLSAATNGLVDTAASSVGGWAGARAGAMLGALLGPVGAAAGGLIGGFLGKQVAAGMAAGTREKRLRELLAQQERLLAQVPRVAALSFAAQARHLNDVAEEFVGVGASFELWPSSNRVAREQLRAEYRRWQEKATKQSRQLGSWLRSEPSEAKQSERGAQLLREGRLPWSMKLLELRCELVQLAGQIDAEVKRLGSR